MASYVAIANMAASLIGEDDQLRNPDDDTHMGRTFRALWDVVRQEAIREHSWNFATRRKGLAAEALEDVPYPWAFSFPLPADSLRLIEVLGCTRSDYQLEGFSILSNRSGPIYIRYLIDVAETARWDAAFTGAFAALMAYHAGERIAGSSYDKQAGWALYRSKVSAAKRSDARENPPVEFEPTEWELARFSDGGSGPPYGIPKGYPTS
ncbi:hypothetical protein [Sphingomonas sp. LaA6.9]|uniref:hypothetical protein n=1 Tax=Sphingomonas sp. LaA6.9 TaxID=2919914 RepID=UPI001F4FF64E|nr:hypothetical protein [Sphingomonas sp. LaA6.9]MCJ8159857.1 hypothetical protein [Sphingomonas sp. LaA6.9]